MIPEETAQSGQRRMDSTRVSADQLFNELLENTNLEEEVEEANERDEVGLALYVGKDGSTTLGSRNAKSVVTGRSRGMSSGNASSKSSSSSSNSNCNSIMFSI